MRSTHVDTSGDDAISLRKLKKSHFHKALELYTDGIAQVITVETILRSCNERCKVC